MKDYEYGYGYGWHEGEAPFTRLEPQAGEGEAVEAVEVKGVGGAARGDGGSGWKEEIRRWGMPFDVAEGVGYPDGGDGRRTPTPTLKEEAYAGAAEAGGNAGGNAGAYKGGSGEVVAGAGASGGAGAAWRATPSPTRAKPEYADGGVSGGAAGGAAQAAIDGRRPEDRSAQPPGVGAGNGGAGSAGAGNWWVQQQQGAANGQVEAKGDIYGRERTEDRSAQPPGATGHAEDPYERMYRLFAREAPKKPDYRREKAERMGAILSNTFKLLADATMVALDASGKGSLMYGHQVGADNLTERLAAVNQREAAREEQHRQEARETESYNKQLALTLYKMRRDDELAEARSKEAQRQHTEKLAMDAQKLEWEAAKYGSAQQLEINKFNANNAKEWEMHKDKNAVDVYNAETDRKKVENEISSEGKNKGKPYTTMYADAGDGKGMQLIDLEEGHVAKLFTEIQKIEKENTGKDDPDIKVLLEVYGATGNLDKRAVNHILARHADNPKVKKLLREILYGSGAGKGTEGTAGTTWTATGGMYRLGAGKGTTETEGTAGTPMRIFRN